MENFSRTADKKLVLSEANLNQAEENATTISVAMENGSTVPQSQMEKGFTAAQQSQMERGSTAPQPPTRIGANEKNLSMLAIGESGTIKAVMGEGKIRRRLFDMGLTQGTEVYMKKRAPLGDPLELTVRGYSLSLRKSEAANIVMEVRTK